MTIGHAKLKEILDYDEDTGKFTWKVKASARAHEGRVAGYVRKRDGYIVIRIEGRGYAAHRLAWFFVHGTWAELIDHKDRNRTNNALANLREATASQNGMNVAATALNTSGYRGVTWNRKAGKWQAQSRLNGKNNYLGLFDSASDASKAYESFCEANHGQFFVGKQGEAA